MEAWRTGWSLIGSDSLFAGPAIALEEGLRDRHSDSRRFPYPFRMQTRLDRQCILKVSSPIQTVPLPGGRVAVRAGTGEVSIRGWGQSASILIELLSQIDGRRSLEEIRRNSGLNRPLAELGELLAPLVTEGMLQAVPVPASTQRDSASSPAASSPFPPHQVLVAGEGRLASRIVEALRDSESESIGVSRLERIGSRSSETLVDDIKHADLAIAAMEGESYASFFSLQSACLQAGLGCLFLALDADGLRLGPSVAPGAGPCFSCASATSFSFLGLSRPDLHERLSSMRTLSWEANRSPAWTSSALESALEALVAETRELLADGGRPALLARVLMLTRRARSYPVQRSPQCPLCSHVSARDAAPLSRRLRLLALQESVASCQSGPRRMTASSSREPVRLGILGGGTAGYLAALAVRRKLPHVKVTLIESSRVPVIGVGEATTPILPRFLHIDLGLDPKEFFRIVQPTFKLGIRFRWGSDASDGAFNYPFGGVRVAEALAYQGDIEECSLRSMLMSAGGMPLGLADPDSFFGLDSEVAYHIDNRSFVEYLQGKAESAGVQRIDRLIESAVPSADGRRIAGLIGEDGQRMEFDQYVDCSGFRSVLLEKALGSKFISFGRSLFADCAIAASVPNQGRSLPYTLAEAMDCGWCWNTPQRSEDHRGYVFSSQFCSPQQAEEEMRQRNPAMGDARLIRFRAGRHEHFRKGNVFALGNAYGFVEPLESTALHMLVRQIDLMIADFPWRPGGEETINRRVGQWWDYLKWFLAIHYRFNQRQNTPFWRACRHETDVSDHQELIEALRRRGPLSCDPLMAESFDYPDPLWGPEGIDVILLGQQVETTGASPFLDEASWRSQLDDCRSLLAQAASHRDALEILDRRPDLLDRFRGNLARSRSGYSH